MKFANLYHFSMSKFTKSFQLFFFIEEYKIQSKTFVNKTFNLLSILRYFITIIDHNFKPFFSFFWDLNFWIYLVWYNYRNLIDKVDVKTECKPWLRLQIRDSKFHPFFWNPWQCLGCTGCFLFEWQFQLLASGMKLHVFHR